jgi:hypothetical protein
MKMTIIPSDKAVYVNGVVRSELFWEGTPITVHALQWYDVEGWIEYNDGAQNEPITALPQWADNAYQAWVQAGIPVPPEPPTAEQNQATAVAYLSETDWTALPDVADPLKSNPYLANADAFNTYRNAVRQYALTPVAGNVDWPIRPVEDWRTV